MSKIGQLKEKAELTECWFGLHNQASYPSEFEALFPLSMIQSANAEIRNWPGYQRTKLLDLDEIAGAAGVEHVLYKDESTRFGLGSFKALGGAYAVMCYLAERLTKELGKPVSLEEVRSGAYSDKASKITVATATDGNHGRSVAWGAKMAGCQCRIYIHQAVSQGRADAMAQFGATIIRVKGDYDASVRLAAEEAKTNHWQIISDTSYDGYREIPLNVMAGYTVMVSEILQQLNEPPTHVIIQAGVGGLAAAVCAAFWAETDDKRPRFIVTEADRAACILESMRAGKPSHVEIKQETIMAGLSCGEISLVAFDILSKGVCAVTTLPDGCVPDAMRYMASIGIEAGECAVPGIITLLALSKDKAMMKKLALNEKSRVLVFGCEGATDPVLYRSILEGK